MHFLHQAAAPCEPRLPAAPQLNPPTQGPVTDRQRAAKPDGHFGIGFAPQISACLRVLVVMAIEKRTSRCRITCPKLLEGYFDGTSPVAIGPVHFTKFTSTFRAVARRMRSEHTANQRWLLAAWEPNCAVSIPYPLFKYKDIVATCAHVFASKGKCCRCRPVVPTTHHPARRLLKQVSKTLSMICSLMPISGQFHISNSAQFRTRIDDAEPRACLHYTTPSNNGHSGLAASLICSMR